MLKNGIVGLAIISTFVLSLRCGRAQSVPASGLYQIVSGSYTECCGIAGNDFGYELPNESQGFVRFTVDEQKHVASMTFLAEDTRTVFRTSSCVFSGDITFSFDYGLIFSNRTIFHVDPGPPPYDLAGVTR